MLRRVPAVNPLTRGTLASLEASIRAATGNSARIGDLRPVAGGDINRAAVLRHGGQRLFVKWNEARWATMFAAEARGLRELADSHTLRVPRPICDGQDDAASWLVLEFLALQPAGDEAALGAGLAQMHRCTADRHGWQTDNTIGTTAQPNRPDSDWLRFWRQQRLQHQLELAARNGYGGRLQSLGGRLLAALPDLLAGHQPAPSLLHGDLWAGNRAFLASGEPVIYDPAVYYGDRETDLAMTELFGGFGDRFRAAYRAHFPLAPGYERRRTLYNLYHVLNHLNLFGASYLARAEHMIRDLLETP